MSYLYKLEHFFFFVNDKEMYARRHHLMVFSFLFANYCILFRADNPERTKRYFREAPGKPRVHIHVRRAGSFSEQFALLFRDYMRTHPDIAFQYAQLKIGLAQQYSQVEGRHLYTEAKNPFIWKVMAQADEWAQQTGWMPGPSDA